MYSVLNWKDHAVSPSNTYSVKENSDGTITLTPAGTVIQQGTNMNAANFNNLETGVLAANAAALEALNALRIATDRETAHDEQFTETEQHFDNVEQLLQFVNVTALEASRTAMLGIQKAEALEGIVLQATLTNTQAYPFNNSTKTIALSADQTRVTKDYTVITEVESYAGDCVGEVLVSDKMLNGFKLRYTGSATEVNLKIYVQGGI